MRLEDSELTGAAVLLKNQKFCRKVYKKVIKYSLYCREFDSLQ